MRKNEKKWTKISGSAIKISVDQTGNAWVVNNKNTIFKHNGKSWDKQSGKARDIGVGMEGTIWVIGTNKVGKGGWGIYRMETGHTSSLWGTNTQKSLNWKKGIKWELRTH